MTQHNMDTLLRYRGAMMGLATGDALGVPGEFQPRGAYQKITEMIGGGPFHLKPGEWTDDTSMALCLGKSLIDKNGFDAKDQMDKYWYWIEAGYMSSNGRMFDIGDTTSEALCYFRKHGEYLAGLATSSDNKKSGNGSIMRLAPVPMFFKDGPSESSWMDMASLSSMLTHGSLNCMGSCIYLSRLICGALNGVSKEEILNPDFFMKNKFVQGVLNNTHKQDLQDFTPEVIDIAKGSYKTKTEGQIKSTGYVIHTLEAALWCFYTTNTFEEGCIKAVNLGDDTDTVGAVYGQLAGAYYGLDAIPKRWINKIAFPDLIIEVADKLFEKRKT